MKRMLRGLCLLALLLFLLPAAALPPDPDGTVWGGAVRGTVIEPDGKPVGGASVCMIVNQWQPEEYKDFQIQTRPDGSFAFRELHDTQYPVMVVAVKPGWV